MSGSSIILAANSNGFNDIPVVRDIGGRNVEVFTNHSINQRRALVSVAPTTSVASFVWGSASQLDYRIENNIDRITAAYIKLDVNNSSGASCVTSAGPLHIQKIEIYANNGATLLYSSNSNVANFLIDAVHLSRTEWNNTAAIRGTLANNYGAGALTTTNTTVYSFYYPIAPAFFRALKLRPYTINGNLLIRIKFSDVLVTSGTLTTTACNLLLMGYYESEQQKAHCLKRAEIPKCLSYYAPQVQHETLTLAASSSYNLRLSGLNGFINQVYFAVRAVANAAIPANLATFVRLSSFDILNPSSQSLTGFKVQTESDMVLAYSHQFDNEFINNNNAHIWTFSQQSASDIGRGSWNGGIEVRGDHYLQLNTASTLAGGSYEIIVIAMMNEMLTVVGAQLRTTRS
jgi:hypothetical protein